MDEIKPFIPGSEKSYSHFYQPHTPWPKLEPQVFTLPSKYKIDLPLFRAQLQPFLKKMKDVVHLDLTSNYNGYGFSYANENAHAGSKEKQALKMFSEGGKYTSSARMLKENVSKIRYRNSNELQELLTDETPDCLRNYLKNFQSPLKKVRLLSLAAGYGIRPHVDLPYYEEIRIQIPLFSHEKVEWYVEDRPFHLPDNGNAYCYDVGVSHSILNSGPTDRVVLTIHLSLYKNRSGNFLYGPEHSLSQLMHEGAL